jgi:hypothetical protein
MDSDGKLQKREISYHTHPSVLLLKSKKRLDNDDAKSNTSRFSRGYLTFRNQNEEKKSHVAKGLDKCYSYLEDSCVTSNNNLAYRVLTKRYGTNDNSHYKLGKKEIYNGATQVVTTKGPPLQIRLPKLQLLAADSISPNLTTDEISMWSNTSSPNISPRNLYKKENKNQYFV